MMNILHFRNIYRGRKIKSGSAFFFLPFYQKLPSTSTTLSSMVTASTITTSELTTMARKIQPVALNKKPLPVDSQTFTVKTTQTLIESMMPQLLTQSTTRPSGASRRWSRSYYGSWISLSDLKVYPDVYSEETKTLTPESGQDIIEEKDRIDLKVEKKAKTNCVSVPSVYCWTAFLSSLK
jgi:hypothetical protein